MKRTTQTKLSKRPSISTASKRSAKDLLRMGMENEPRQKRKYTRKVQIAVLSKETAPPLDVSPAVEQKVIVRQSTLESIHSRLSNIEASLQKMAFSLLVIGENKPVKRSEPEDFVHPAQQPATPVQLELPLEGTDDGDDMDPPDGVTDVSFACDKEGLDHGDFMVDIFVPYIRAQVKEENLSREQVASALKSLGVNKLSELTLDRADEFVEASGLTLSIVVEELCEEAGVLTAKMESEAEHANKMAKDD
jgi:hypothetical protein